MLYYIKLSKFQSLFLLGCGGLWNGEMSMTGENLVKEELGPPAENGTGEGDQDETGDDVI